MLRIQDELYFWHLEVPSRGVPELDLRNSQTIECQGLEGNEWKCQEEGGEVMHI